MTGFPKAEAERAALARLLDALDGAGETLSAAQEVAQGQARSWLARLETPVTIAVLGTRGAGKSSLINLLVCDAVLPVGGAAAALPPIVLRHAARDETTAAWWDRAERRFEGLALEAALAEAPDVITFGTDCELLEHVRFVDLPDLEDPEARANALYALKHLADMVIWCAPAGAGWGPRDAELWRLLPAALQRRSVLARTHADLVAGDPAAGDLAMSGAPDFAAIRPIATTEAWQALRGEAAGAETRWARSGAEAFFVTVAATAAEFRAAEIEKIARGIQQVVAPVLGPLAEAAEAAAARTPAAPAAMPAAVPAKAPVAEAPTPPAAAPPAPAAAAGPGNPMLADWLAAIEAPRRAAAAGALDSEAAFLAACAAAVEDFLAGAGLADGGDWLVAEFEAARDLLVLLPYETGTAAGATAARLLVQLTDLLAWAGTGAGAAPAAARRRARA